MSGRSAFIAVVDFETTGFSAAEGHVPIEVGRCDLVAGCDLLGDPLWGDGEISWQVSSLLRPERPIPPESSAIHHLVDEDFDDPKLLPRGSNNCVVISSRLAALAAHSARFEQQWLTPELTGAVPWICTWKCALRAFPEAPGHSNQTLRYWLKPPGLDRDLAAPAHRAGPDAYVTAFLLRELLRLHPIETLIQWSQEPALLIRVPFGKAPPYGSRGLRWSEIEDGLIDWVLDRDFDEDVMHTARVERERRRAARQAETPECQEDVE